MPYAHPYAAFGRQYRAQNNRNIPEYNAVVFEYKFEEGNATAGSMRNILFDSKNPASIGANLVTNEEFEGTYVAGVAPDWTVDAGVTANEEVVGGLEGSSQQLTDCNGTAQGLHSATITVVAGKIYYFEIGVRKNAGAGNLQIQVTNMNGMATNTYDISNADMGAQTTKFSFYLVANNTTSTITITASATTLDFTVVDVFLREIGGGNHMVMDFTLYDESARNAVSYDFNGVDHYFYIEDSRQSGLEIGNSQLSFACIAKLDTAGPGHLFSKWKNTDFSYVWSFEGSRFFRQYVSTNGAATQDYRGTFTFAVPMASYIFAGTAYDTPNGLARMNINGVAETVAYSAGPPLTIVTLKNNAYRTAIGASFNATPVPANFVNGRVGKLVCWKGAYLTNSQFIQVYNILRTTYGI